MATKIDYKAAADAAGRLLTQFELLKTVAESFAGIASLEQATVEAQNALAAAQDKLAQCQAQQATAQSAAAEASAAAQAIRAEAERARAAAETYISDLVTDAKRGAAEIVANARAHAAGTISDSEARVAALNVKGQVLAGDVEALTKKMDALKAKAAQLIG